MIKSSKEYKKYTTYGIIGLGRFGFAIALELSKNNVDLIVVDNDPEKVSKAKEITENAFIVENINKHTLKKIGFDKCDVVVVCMASQIDASILITLDLVELGIPRVISKARNEKHGIILEKLGAEVVYPEKDMGIRLANRLENSKTLDYVSLSESINISKVRATKKSDGKNIIDLQIRPKYGCNIIALERGKEVIDQITPSLIIKNDDVLYVTGRKENLERLTKDI